MYVDMVGLFWIFKIMCKIYIKKLYLDRLKVCGITSLDYKIYQPIMPQIWMIIKIINKNDDKISTIQFVDKHIVYKFGFIWIFEALNDYLEWH